jgi:hypothetical protein
LSSTTQRADGPLHYQKIWQIDTAQVVEITGATNVVADVARNIPLSSALRRFELP